MFFQLLSVAGAVLILIAYVAHQLRRMSIDNVLYQALNCAGGTCLTITACVTRQYGFILMGRFVGGDQPFRISQRAPRTARDAATAKMDRLRRGSSVHLPRRVVKPIHFAILTARSNALLERHRVLVTAAIPSEQDADYQKFVGSPL